MVPQRYRQTTWLTDERRVISTGVWTPPPLRKANKPLTFGDYATKWKWGFSRLLESSPTSPCEGLVMCVALPRLGSRGGVAGDGEECGKADEGPREGVRAGLGPVTKVAGEVSACRPDIGEASGVTQVVSTQLRSPGGLDGHDRRHHSP